MKYCKKCGMLLENNMMSCIGCGSDVSQKGSWTNYPIKMQEKLDLEKKERNKRNITSAIKIAVIMLLLLGCVGLLIAFFVESSEAIDSSEEGVSISSKPLGLNDEEPLSDEELAALREKRLKNRKILDDEGYYYKYDTYSDESGKEIFTAIYPEDLKVVDYSVDNSKYSNVNPAVFSFVAQNEENTARFTYMSTQHFVYFDKGARAGRSNEADTTSNISMLKYDGARNYIEMLIKQFYPGSKKVEFEEEIKAIDTVCSSIKSEYEKLIAGDADLALMCGLGEGAKLNKKNAEVSSSVYKYRIVNKNSEAVTVLFYVPLVAATYEYVDSTNDDKGELTNWFVLSIVGFEAGSDDYYDEYIEGYDLFLNNSRLHDEFFDIEQYASNEYNSYYDFFMTALNSSPTATRSFAEGEYSISTEDNIEQVFIAPERKLVFATHSDKEYPGEPYFDLWPDSSI